MRKLLMAGGLAALAAAGGYVVHSNYGGWFANQPAQAQRGGPVARGVPVETVRARAIRATADIRAVGSLQSDEAVKVAPEIAGRIAVIAFKEGEAVEKDALLVQLDDSLARAESADAQARFELAKANYDRATQLGRSGNITERAQDEARSAFETARAAVELARVRLAKHSLTAPFPGTVGLRGISVGAFVNVGAEIVNLEKLDTLKVDFKVPEIFLGDVRVGQDITVVVDALPDRTFEGMIYAIDPLVDVNGRALQLRARIPNPERVLRPGLFARITIRGPARENVVTVPESAVVPRGSDSFVFRIENGKAIETKVRLGERKAGEVQVIEGLNAGAAVVTAGQQRLRDGASVDIVTADGAAVRG